VSIKHWIPTLPRRGFGAAPPRRRIVVSVSLAILAISLVSSVRQLRAATTPTFVVFTDKNAFEAALDAAAPGTRRNIYWDGLAFDPPGSKFIPANQSLASRQIILDPDSPTDELLVSNVEFANLRGNYATNFPFFSPSLNFKYVADDGQPNVFRLADRQTPGPIRAFGVVFTDVEKRNRGALRAGCTSPGCLRFRRRSELPQGCFPSSCKAANYDIVAGRR
jgi:hypothetical protein